MRLLKTAAGFVYGTFVGVAFMFVAPFILAHISYTDNDWPRW